MGLAWTAIWPAYLALLALVARRGPWPRSLAVPLATIMAGLAIAALVRSLLCWIFHHSGWAVRYLELPESLVAQLNKAGRSLVLLAIVLLLPAYLLGQGEIAPEGRPVLAPSLSRFLVIGFELAACVYLVRVSRRGIVERVQGEPDQPTESLHETSLAASAPPDPRSFDSSTIGRTSAGEPGISLLSSLVEWVDRRRRLLPWSASFVVLAIILLEARGYSFTARRLAVGLSQSALVIAMGWSIYRVISRAIEIHPWVWTGSAPSWTKSLTSKVASNAGSRLMGSLASKQPLVAATKPTEEEASSFGPDMAREILPDEGEALARRARQLLMLSLTVVGGLVLAWVWDLDLALIHTLADKELGPVDAQTKTSVKLGELVTAMVYLALGVAAWRHMSALFAVFLFPRMSDDPGVRFAVVTLCRYAVLGLTAILALGAIHLDMARIGVVVAALGVGLGFGLQEVVSNFVCGIILLLERPIRIGDTVTVAGTSGRVDRINIRATTIVNFDNQSMIVPNREFITGNLVNWTYRDKVIRVPIRLGVAYGTDPDKVVDLLQGIALADADVLRNPVPSAQMESFGDSALMFALYAFVPDPSLMGRVRHRLCTEIHRRFAEEDIQIPFPIHELHLNRIPEELTKALQSSKPGTLLGANRLDQASRTLAGPHNAADLASKSTAVAYKEDYCRGVDE